MSDDYDKLREKLHESAAEALRLSTKPGAFFEAALVVADIWPLILEALKAKDEEIERLKEARSNATKLLELYGAFDLTEEMDGEDGFRHGAITTINELLTRLEAAEKRNQ